MFTSILSKRNGLLKLVALILFVGINTSYAQTAPKAILTAGDIQLFLKSFNPLKADLEKLGHKYDNMNHNTITALSANDEVKAVFKKHGWDDDYFTKVSAIVYSYSYLKSIAEIDKLPADQKQMMEAMLGPMKAQFEALVHADDIKAVKQKYAEVDQFFEKQ